MSEPVPFQRARRPAQVEMRRVAIFAAARRMLSERSVREVTLRDLAEHAGMAKSNVLRYFDSREAVFLELLIEEWESWLDHLAVEIAAERDTAADDAAGQARRLAAMLAETLSGRPVLCDLFAAMSIELETNVSFATARSFKQRAYGLNDRLVELILLASPGLTETAATGIGRALIITAAGLWPFAHPNDIVAAAALESGIRLGPERFQKEFGDITTALVIGFAARRGD
ncbi:TetR family transcriptional regulator [Nocardia sp. NPDC049220]|uniref:TetR/AcrR family transcriptional regulator n=1 Tax=Nocardia sp. NPDC049220 TaxID=3155273 RepID=UPI00340D2790